jgi:hypothetical protein
VLDFVIEVNPFGPSINNLFHQKLLVQGVTDRELLDAKGLERHLEIWL